MNRQVLVSGEGQSALSDLATRLVERIQEDVTGLNLSRVIQFVEEQGFGINRERKCIIFNPSELLKVQEILGNTGLLIPEFYDNCGIQGAYVPEINCILVLRDSALEAVNDPTLIEAFLVHEMMHASAHKLIKEGWFRSPYDETYWGTFLEEGWADLHRGIYRSRYMELKSLQEK